MEKVNIATTVWRSKEDGDIPLSDRINMPDEYLQNILNNSEHRYMFHNNNANTFQQQLEELEKKSIEAYKRSLIFKSLILAIQSEADRRGIKLLSLTDKNPNKFDILRRDFKKEMVMSDELIEVTSS